jgi:hypothetical protein
MKKTTAAVLTAVLFLHSSQAVWGQAQASGVGQTSSLPGEFVSRLPVGTSIRLKLDDGAKLTGTLMAVEDDAIIIKRRTRLPEPPIRLTLNRIVDADVQRSSGMGKAIAIGAGVGAGATLGVLLLLAAMLGD